MNKRHFFFTRRLHFLYIGVAVIIVLLCYQLSISNTIKMYVSYKNNIEKIKELQSVNSTSSVQVFSNKEKCYKDSSMAINDILNLLSKSCYSDKLKLREYQPYPITTNNNIRLLTQRICLEGNFQNCLDFLYLIETKYIHERISSVTFLTENDLENRKKNLLCTITLQTIINNENEN